MTTVVDEKAVTLNSHDRAFIAPGRRITSSVLRIIIVSRQTAGWDRVLPPGHSVTIISDGSVETDPQSLADADMVYLDLASMKSDVPLDEICFALHRRGVLTVGIASTGSMSTKLQIPHYEIRQGVLPTLFDNVANEPLGAIDDIDFVALVRANELRRWPRVTLIYVGTLVSKRDLAGLERDGLIVEAVMLASDPSSQSWAESIATARGNVVVFVAAGGNVTAAEFVRTCVFEHWYPEVEFCCESVDPREPCGLDLRRFSLRGDRARADVVAALSASDDMSTIRHTLCAGLAERGAVIAAVEKNTLGRRGTSRARSWSGFKRTNLSWLRDRLVPRRNEGIARKDRRLRILAYRWHVAHQYELMRLPADFTFVNGFDGHITEAWAYEQRPQPPNVKFRHRSQIDPRDYDVAIVHFDENVLCPELSNGVLLPVWGMPFSWLLSLGSIPKIGICHGTPAFKGQYALDPGRKSTFEVHEQERSNLVDALADAKAFVVCNSFQAEREWGFKNSRVIWHGFSPEEFRKGSLSRGVLTSPDDLLRPHYRGRFEQQEVLQALNPAIDVCQHLRQAPLEIRATNAYAMRQFRFYVDQVSAFRFYLNTTLRSPMPRSRGEAMMTGVIPVSLANHDVEMFIDNGRDGFFSSRTSELATFINDIARDARAVDAISKAARTKAIDTFHIDRFLADWIALLKEVVG